VRGAIAWFARNHVAANLLMGLMIIGGLVTVSLIPQEIFPEIETDLITIAVPYRGAAPEEVEEGVCIRIEEELEGIEGIKRIRSTATEGAGVVTAERLGGARRDQEPRRRDLHVPGRGREADRLPGQGPAGRSQRGRLGGCR
jgi:multidrug efflux pump subunit AcrB